MYLLHGDGRHYRGQLGGAPALHHHHGLFHLQLVVEGDELRLGGAFACDQSPLHVGFIEAVQPESSREITHYLREQRIQSYRVDASEDTVVFNLAKQTKPNVCSSIMGEFVQDHMNTKKSRFQLGVPSF